MKRIRVLVVDDIADTRESIRRLLEFEKDIEVVGEAGSGSEALHLAEELTPDIALMDINMPDMDGIRTTELMGMRSPETAVVIMSVQGEQAYLKRAMMAGAREYIVKPFSGSELSSTLGRVYEAEQHKREVYGTQNKPLMEENAARAGRVLSFFSTKGGVGKTTLATNLAVQLASSGKLRVLLIDLNLQFGDVVVFLNLLPRHTIADLAQNEAFTFNDIQSCLLTHSSGLQILAAPTRPEYAELVNAEHVERIIEAVRPHFDFIICDNVSRFDDINLVSFDAAEEIWLILSMDVPTLKNTKLSLEVLEGLHHTHKVQLVLNRASKDVGLSLPVVEKSLNLKISYQIPSDGNALVAALNNGQPFVTSFPQSRASEGVRAMAKALTDGEPQGMSQGSSKPAKARARLSFRRLFGM